ncbi:helix-turn-helix domain-containing protein [Candidatus Dojkabacteria bacterium]|nr:helix-turn-helix domain-containing protein [Candidatus Dojkabacteria bacterium]
MINSTFKIQTIGELLKEKRAKKGLSLRQISEITKIRVEYLQALEDGRYSAFPSEVYLKGFLKNYAKFLGIDKERSLALYRRENKILEKEQLKQSTGPGSKVSFNTLLTPERIIIAIVAIISGLIGYYIVNQIGVVLENPELQINTPVLAERGETKEMETEDETINFSGIIAPNASLSINGDPVTTNNLNRFEIVDLNLNEGRNEFVIVAESQFGRRSEIVLIVNRIVINETTDQTVEKPADLNGEPVLTPDGTPGSSGETAPI